MRPLPPRRTRRFVVVLVAVMLGLALLATFLITRGWQDETLVEQVREMEEWHESR